MEDLKAAIRWVRMHADEWGFDPEKVIASGDSAGAATALFHGYAQKARKDEGNSGNPGFPSNANGVITVSGALKEQIHCKSIDPVPSDCIIDNGIDETSDVGTFP